MKKAIETSFDLLEKSEKDALVLLSVFPGSFDSDAAEALVEVCTNSMLYAAYFDPSVLEKQVSR